MDNTRARMLVDGVAQLASLPEVCVRINEMVDDATSSANEMANVIMQDASLTGRLLKVANSSFYRFPSKIDTVARAVTIIGTRELRFIVLATSAVRSFDRLPNDIVDMASFWRHSVYCGVIARILAGKCHVLHRERLFVCGLLHDVGRLIMYHRIPDLVRVMHYRAQSADISLYEAERDVYDTDHCEVGSELLKAWGLPPSVVEVVAFHHEPNKAEKHVLETSIIHIANSLATLAELGGYANQALPVNPFAWEVTGLSPSIIETTLQEARGQFLEALLMFLPGAVAAHG